MTTESRTVRRCYHEAEGVRFDVNGLSVLTCEHGHRVSEPLAVPVTFPGGAVVLTAMRCDGSSVTFKANLKIQEPFDRAPYANAVLSSVTWCHEVPGVQPRVIRLSRPPRVVAEHHQDSREVRSHTGDVIRSVSADVEVRVECDADQVPAALAALAALDRAVEDVRAQLAYLARIDGGPVLVPGDDVQDERKEAP